jgi:broad specificity phosphatase PhoE
MDYLIVARHGESEASAQGIVNGDPSRPVGLTARGREEAARLGESLARERIDLCVVTEFPRTVETADIALAGRAAPRLVLADLDDPSFGEFEGRRIDQFRAWFQEQGPAWAVGGERRVDTVRRFARGYRELLARPEGTILVIAHGLPVTYAVRAANGESLPLTLEGVQVEHALPYRLTAADVQAAVAALEAWAGRHDPTARSPEEAAS